MITVTKARKILKEEAEKLSDEQIRELLDQLYLLADVALAVLLQNKK